MNNPSEGPSTAPNGPEGPDPEIASFPARVAQTFFSPGKLSESLAARPVWIGALILGAVLVGLQSALIPIEVWESMFRETMIQRGQAVPEGMGSGGVAIMRISALVAGPIMYCVMAFLFAGVATLVFSFILGDEGRYKQYLAMVSHALIIPTFVGLLLVPLRIAEQNPQLTLNLGTFLYFLPDGYLSKVLTMLDISQFWAWAVVGMGAHAIDSRRSVGSAVSVLIALSVILALIFANFVPSAG
ncbi:MAG: hypothetical protein P8170_03305 [Gemmatimonadota bacterium]|jgi:hypothetical protein